MRRRMPRGEEGAYAILYGLLLVVILGTAALVVDLAAMREDRRASRLASDAAVVAGARWLDPLAGANPYQACVETLSYVSTNMNVAAFDPTPCNEFTGLTCETSVHTATASSEDVDVLITWPVFQTSPLLTDPDVQGDAAAGAQTVDVEVDGAADTACSRLGVSITQQHEPFLAGVFGAGDTVTTVTSVARAMTVPGGEEAIAALNVLNETDCQAILTSGQGFILVNDVDDRPGIISVESDGTGGCGNNQYVIDPADNNSGAYVRADGPGGLTGEGKGIIYSYALNAAPKGVPADAYDPSLVPPSNILLRPAPSLLATRVGDSPVRDIYDCSAPCDEYPESYVTTLRAALQNGTPQPYEHHESPYDTAAFTTLSGGSCNIGTQQSVLLPVGNYFFNCNNAVNVAGRLFVAGGTVVVRNGISVGAQGCFAMNVPLVTAPGNCNGLVVSGDTVPSPTKGAILYLRDGNFTKGAQGSIIMPRTFVYMNSDQIDFGAGSGLLFWTNPRQSATDCDDTKVEAEMICNASRFSKLALWNESTTDQSLGGQSALTVRGVVFVPKATFVYTGQPTQNQTNAQFWADKLEVKGQSGLTMAPDPTDAVPSPSISVVLIR